MATQRLGQAVFWSEEIDGSSLAVVLRENSAVFAFFTGNLVPGDIDLLHNFIPAELVGVVLREVQLACGWCSFRGTLMGSRFM